MWMDGSVIPYAGWHSGSGLAYSPEKRRRERSHTATRSGAVCAGNPSFSEGPVLWNAVFKQAVARARPLRRARNAVGIGNAREVAVWLNDRRPGGLTLQFLPPLAHPLTGSVTSFSQGEPVTDSTAQQVT